MNIYTITNRLMRVWHNATRTERTNGRQWYNTARIQARLMANDHNVLRERISYIMAELNLDELRVVEYVSEGLMTGRTRIGPLDLASDKRDWAEERDQEARDLLVYAACEVLKGRGR